MQNNDLFSKLSAIALLVTVIAGCSKLTGKTATEAVPKEQIDMDIATQKIPAAGGADWDFSKDSMRCFKVYDEKSTISDAEATLFVSVAAAQGDMNAKLGTGVTLDTLFGGLRISYKKKGDNWVLDKVTPDQLSRKRLGEADLSTFFNIAAPLCSYYEKKK